MTEYRIKGRIGEWKVVIGLEVHAQGALNAGLAIEARGVRRAAGGVVVIAR